MTTFSPHNKVLTAAATNRMRPVPVFAKPLIPLFLLTAISAVGLVLLALRGRHPSDSTQLLFTFVFRLMVVSWVQVDAREQRYHAPFDFDAFLFFAWPFVLPYYLYRTRGARGLLLTAGIFALATMPDVVADVIRIARRLT